MHKPSKFLFRRALKQFEYTAVFLYLLRPLLCGTAHFDKTVFLHNQIVLRDMYRKNSLLTLCNLETPKSVFSKQCRPRSDTADHLIRVCTVCK